MATKKKLGDSPVTDWHALNSIGDVKRMLRWACLSLRNNTMERADAATFTLIGNALLRACEGSELEKRLETLERNEELRQARHIPRSNGEIPIGTSD